MPHKRVYYGDSKKRRYYIEKYYIAAKKISDFYYDTEKQARKAFEDVIQSLKKRNEDNCVIIRDEKAANEKWQETDIWFTLYEKRDGDQGDNNISVAIFRLLENKEEN